MNSKVMKIYFFIAIIVNVTLILIDYFNIPYEMGINISEINLDFWMSVFNIGVVIMLYIITFTKIENKAIKKEENKNEIAQLLIYECYRSCDKHIKYLDDEIITKYIVPKIDFKSTDNPIIGKITDIPFSNEDIIMEFVKDGQLSKETLKNYLLIKDMFSTCVIDMIIAFDYPSKYQKIKDDFIYTIGVELKKLEMCDK